MDARDPAATLGVVDSLGRSRSPPGVYVLFANFPISSFSFISPRVSVITLKSLKLWVILRFDMGFFFSFFDWKEAEIGEKGSPWEGAAGKESNWPHPSPCGCLT